MTTALLGRQRRFYVQHRRAAWTGVPHRYSGFVREVVGDLPSAESRVVAAIRRAHPNLNGSAKIVRLLPREADAILLGGLQRVLGPFSGMRQIRATYSRRGDLVVVGGLRVDGSPRTGSVGLTASGRCAADTAHASVAQR